MNRSSYPRLCFSYIITREQQIRTRSWYSREVMAVDNEHITQYIMYNACTSITSIKHESSVQVRRCSTYIYSYYAAHEGRERKKEWGNRARFAAWMLQSIYVCAAVYIAPCSTVGREGKLAFDIMIGLLRYNCTILRVVYLATVEIETCQG